MTQLSPLPHEMQQDLHFVRNAVEAKDQPRPASGRQLIIWICYSLICIPAYDYAPRYAGQINLFGWIIAMVIGMIIGKRDALRAGEYNRAGVTRMLLHWWGGIALLFVAVYGLANAHTGLTPTGAGQVSVVLVGFLYFTAGIHLPHARFMRWAGPVIVLAGIGMGFLPQYRWTAMGLIFAACLLCPLIFGGRKNLSATQP